MASSRTDSQKQRELTPKPTPDPVEPEARSFRVAQIDVNVMVDNGYGSPVPAPGGPFSFGNTAEGTAAEHLMGWLAANFLTSPDAEKNGTLPDE